MIIMGFTKVTPWFCWPKTILEYSKLTAKTVKQTIKYVSCPLCHSLKKIEFLSSVFPSIVNDA